MPSFSLFVVLSYLSRFNGKSFVIADSGRPAKAFSLGRPGYVIKDPEGEWMEVGVELSKSVLSLLKSTFGSCAAWPPRQFSILD